jgi:hypothetical protein
MEVSVPEENIIQMLLDDINERNREADRKNAVLWKQSGSG